MSSLLFTMADLSQLLSIIATLFCFLGMVCYIMKNLMVFRLHQDIALGGVLNHSNQQRTQKVHMMKITIPFVLKLNESNVEVNCVDCTITSQVTYTIRVFWGVSIRELHTFLWKPWSLIKRSAESGEMLKGFYQLKGMQATCDSHKDSVFSIRFPHDSLDLGIPPRLFYPLVIFLIRDSPDANVHPDETVALINVVHIKDTVCTLPTSILAQYLKQANGQLSCLKQLYLAAGNPFSAEEAAAAAAAGPFDKEDMSVWAVAGEQLCVVCQYYPLSRVLLPCRHTCVCAVCFEKLDRCPMCRSPFSEFFTVRAEDYFPVDKSPAALKPGLLSWIFNLGQP